MPLQNRVDPFGELRSTPARGLMMGNRGGRFHDESGALRMRRWASRRWICCRLDFKNRRRRVWGSGYTELFFLDEVTALAAGHRPCFECRREAAQRFFAFWAQARGLDRPPRADEIDSVLDSERRTGLMKRRHRLPIGALPDGAIIVDPRDGAPGALRQDCVLPWTSRGYAPARARPDCELIGVLTPPSTLAVLSAGYAPMWHDEARG